jgi:hypothetical protein
MWECGNDRNHLLREKMIRKVLGRVGAVRIVIKDSCKSK